MRYGEKTPYHDGNSQIRGEVMIDPEEHKKEEAPHEANSPFTGRVDFVQGFAAPLDQIQFPDAFMPNEYLLESLEKEEE